MQLISARGPLDKSGRGLRLPAMLLLVLMSDWWSHFKQVPSSLLEELNESKTLRNKNA